MRVSPSLQPGSPASSRRFTHRVASSSASARAAFRMLVAMLALAVVAVVAQSASAQDARGGREAAEAEARNVFEAGEVAFTAGRYADALAYFQRAYTLSQRPALLFNIALCQDRLREDDAAVEAYERYLTAVPRAPNREEVDSRLDALRAARARRAQAAVSPANVARAANDEAPRDTTRSAAPAVPGGAPATPSDASPAVYETWWFWTIVGAVVVGGAVGAGVALSADPELESGDVGGVVFTLGGGR